MNTDQIDVNQIGINQIGINQIDNNISFFLQDNNDNNDNNDIDEKKTEIYKLIEQTETDLNCDINNFYGNTEFFYEENTVKELLKICEYYGIEKIIKSAKCKKQDIIATLIYYENMPENFEIVQRRILLWAYLNELINDPKMKKYIIWK